MRTVSIVCCREQDFSLFVKSMQSHFVLSFRLFPEIESLLGSFLRAPGHYQGALRQSIQAPYPGQEIDLKTCCSGMISLLFILSDPNLTVSFTEKIQEANKN